MKTTALILALLLAAITLNAQTNAPASKNPTNDMGMCEAMLLLGSAALAGSLVIYAMNGTGNPGKCTCPAILVLEADEYVGTWKPVATNVIPLRCDTNKFEVFRQQMTGAGQRFRVKVYKLQ
jgi:hypothetical protein